MPKATSKASCPECERLIAVLKDGTMRSHNDKRVRSNDPWGTRCEGSGATPGRSTPAS